jgi:tRNA uridine 5-carbamoylmethylation protein Kti12
MNLIFIYGPPAVGKLTVAEALVDLTGYRLFHNHLTQDLANELYPGFTKNKFELADVIRLEVFEFAAKNNTNLIFTYVYSKDQDSDGFVKNVIDIISKHNGSVYFVQLTAPRDVLLERVGNDSRKRFKKTLLVEELSRRMDEFNLDGGINIDGNLMIDTSLQEASLSAQQIVDYINL